MNEAVNKKRDPYYRFIFDPLFILSFFTMIINDHIFRKLDVPAIVKGKLSDVAILIFLPAVGALLICYGKYLIYLIINIRRESSIDYHLSKWIIISSIAFTALIFILINGSPEFNSLYIAFINRFNILKPLFPVLTSTRDITDLYTLPFLGVSYIVLMKYVFTVKKNQRG